MTPLSALCPLLGAFLAMGCEGATQPSQALGEPATAALQPGRVTVSVGQATYAEGAVISARVANGLEVVLYTEDSKSDCSIAMLERREGDAWQRLPGCSVERLPGVVAIGPGRERSVQINPLSLHFGVTSGSRPAFGAGTYRLRFTYRLQREPLAVEPQTVVSETFRIQS